MRRIFISASLATLLIAGSAIAGGVHPGDESPVQHEQAQQRFLRGKELYSKKNYDAALVEFRGSMDIIQSPNARLYAARCLRELGKLVAAYAEFDRAAVEAKEFQAFDERYKRAAESAADERDKLKPQLAFLHVSVEHSADDTTLNVGGEQILRAGWREPLPVLPGSADVIVSTPGHDPVKQSVTVAAGQSREISIDAAADAPVPPVAPPIADTKDTGKTAIPRTYAYAAAGVGAVGFATFAIAGILANGTYGSLQSACGNNGPCPPGHESDVSKGKTEQTIANVGLVFGILGAGAAVTLYVLGTPKSGNANAAMQLGPGYVGMQGRF